MGPVDAGLQLERTALAWRRTALSAAVASVIALRVLPTALGDPLWILPGMAGALASAALHAAATHRVRAAQRRLGVRDAAISGGALPAVLVVFVATGGLSAFIAALADAFPDAPASPSHRGT